MNGRRARQIRRMAWRAHLQAATQTGDQRYLRGPLLTTTARRIRRYYTRNGAFPTSVAKPGIPESAFHHRVR